jgi:hypothetical protein
MIVNAKTKRLNFLSDNSTLVDLGIRQGRNRRVNNSSLVKDSLEHLVLQSGNKALRNMAQVFRRQMHEVDLSLLTSRKKQALQPEYGLFKTCITH